MAYTLKYINITKEQAKKLRNICPPNFEEYVYENEQLVEKLANLCHKQ